MFPQAQRRRRILGLALPIVAGMVSQVILELVDLMFVGAIGTHAIAAVGISAFVAHIYIGLFFGLSIAVQATVSRCVGAGNKHFSGAYLNAGLLVVLVFGPLTVGFLLYAAPYILAFMNNDPMVLSEGVPYLQWLFACGPLFGLVASFGGYWNAIEKARFYMQVALLSNLLNIPLNYVFIYGCGDIPAMGAAGAGLGTFIATLVAVLYHLYLGWVHARPFGFLKRKPSRQQMSEIISLALPGGLQQTLDAFALALMYRVVGLLGTAEVAVHAVLVNLIGFIGLPAWAFGTAGATLVGQALGKGDEQAAEAWAWDVIKLGVLGLTLLGLPLVLAPDLVLSAFIHEPEVVALGTTITMLVGLMIGFNGVGYMFSAIINGAGAVKQVTLVNGITQYFWLLPLAYLVGPYWGFGIMGVWLVHQFGYRALQSLIYSLLWRSRIWVTAFNMQSQQDASLRLDNKA